MRIKHEDSTALQMPELQDFLRKTAVQMRSLDFESSAKVVFIIGTTAIMRMRRVNDIHKCPYAVGSSFVIKDKDCNFFEGDVGEVIENSDHFSIVLDDLRPYAARSVEEKIQMDMIKTDKRNVEYVNEQYRKGELRPSMMKALDKARKHGVQ